MDFAIESIVMIGLHGGPGVLEHPQEPEELDKPSICRQPLMNGILRLPGFKTMRLSQGLLGAWSAKPTQLWVANLPDLLAHIKQWQLTDRPPGRASIGLAADGTFMTSGLKEYPPALWAALSSAFAQKLPCLTTSNDVLPAGTFLSICKDMCCADMGAHIGADFSHVR